MHAHFPLLKSAIVTLAVAIAAHCQAQVVQPPGAAAPPHHANLLVPQMGRCVRTPGVVRQPAIEIKSISAAVEISEQIALSTLTVEVQNNTGANQETILLLPVPDGAVVKTFQFQGQASEPTTKVLPASEARALYESIVARAKDPGLVEFASWSCIRTSLFPIPAGQKLAMKLVYEHVLSKEGNRVDYVLPRSQVSFADGELWKINVRMRSGAGIAGVYSPSHSIDAHRVDAHQYEIRINEPRVQPGSFMLSYLLGGSDVSSSLMAYPDMEGGDGGYFLLLAGIPIPGNAGARTQVKREVTLALDRSGSMKGEKFEQAVAAAKQVIGSLGTGERFNIIDYNNEVHRFSPEPVVKDAKTIGMALNYLAALQADGGTALHDALVTAVSAPASDNMLPIVLFLTDGLPTVGETTELVIRQNVEKANTAKKRIFTIGVGYDVNVPLLSTVSERSRGATTFVQPNENVETKVAQVFDKLSGPILEQPVLTATAADGGIGGPRIVDMYPPALPDVFENDQIVVFGRYRGHDPLTLELDGTYLGKPRSFVFNFKLDRASTHNSFIPRLWASRRIAYLIDEIRQKGIDPAVAASAAPGSENGAFKELVDEIVRLSTKYGILTEYTSFLAEEGTALSDSSGNSKRAYAGLDEKAVQLRCGQTAVAQNMNNVSQKWQGCLNRGNAFVDGQMNAVEFTTIMQVDDQCFYRRAGRWVEAATAMEKTGRAHDEVVEVGTPEYNKLVDRLAAHGRVSVLALSGEVLLDLDGRRILVKPAAAPAAAAGPQSETIRTE